MLAWQGNAGTASQRGIYAPCLGREHIDKAGCSRLLSMRRHQRVVSSSTELSKLVESAEEHHWEPVKRAAFLLFSICFGQVHPSRPFPYVVFFAPGGTHGGGARHDSQTQLWFTGLNHMPPHHKRVFLVCFGGPELCSESSGHAPCNPTCGVTGVPSGARAMIPKPSCGLQDSTTCLPITKGCF